MIQIAVFYTFQIIKFLIIVRVFLSWVPININQSIKQFIYNLTEPLMSPFRKLVHSDKTGVDLSPMLVLLSLQILQSILI